tara:strand:+ start:237 stop:386 length:150 start_codon:yes stop_codon:yes gene_type:complete
MTNWHNATQEQRDAQIKQLINDLQSGNLVVPTQVPNDKFNINNINLKGV